MTIEPQRAAVDPRYRTVVFVTSTQMGKTAAALNVIGHKIDDDPGPILYLGPTRNNVNSVIEPELTAMLRSVPHLWDATYKGKDANKLAKQIKGVPVRLGWTGSATEVASMPAALVVLDEIDRMEDIPGEGDPYVLAQARLSDYPDGTLYVDATPTTGVTDTVTDPVNGLEYWNGDPKDIESRVWRLLLSGTNHHFAVPCQGCGQWFVPRFSLLVIPERVDGQTNLERARGAGLACPHCGNIHDDRQRLTLVHAGRYIAPGQQIDAAGNITGDPPESDVASFWCSGLMSTKVSWTRRALAWLDAVETGSPATIQSVLNTGFAECYSISGEAPAWEEVAAFRGDYALPDVPPGAQKVFVTVDVGERYLAYTVRAWGHKYQSWGLEAGIIHAEISTGDTDDTCWAQLADLRQQQWGGMQAECLMLDTGYNTEACDAFGRQHIGWCLLMVGRDNPSQLYAARPVEKDIRGKSVKTGLHRWTIDHGHYKSWIHDHIRACTDDPQLPKIWHISQQHSDEYCKQIVGEARMITASGRVRWHKTRANHWLDCEYMQRALADIRGVGRLQAADHGTKQAAPRRMVSLG